jgi:hypothetical protein
MWTVLLPSDTNRKPITSIRTLLLSFVTYLLTPSPIFCYLSSFVFTSHVTHVKTMHGRIFVLCIYRSICTKSLANMRRSDVMLDLQFTPCTKTVQPSKLFLLSASTSGGLTDVVHTFSLYSVVPAVRERFLRPLCGTFPTLCE